MIISTFIITIFLILVYHLNFPYLQYHSRQTNISTRVILTKNFVSYRGILNAQFYGWMNTCFWSKQLLLRCWVPGRQVARIIILGVYRLKEDNWKHNCYLHLQKGMILWYSYKGDFKISNLSCGRQHVLYWIKWLLNDN